MNLVDVFNTALVATFGVACGVVMVFCAGFIVGSVVARVSKWLFW